MRDISSEVELIYGDFGNTLIVDGEDFTSLSINKPLSSYCFKYDGIYKVVYPVTKDRRVSTLLKMHEYGHIYLGHLEGIYNEMDGTLIKLIINKNSDLINLVNKNCNIDYADKILNMVATNPVLNHSIHNIAMDLEINSTILDLDDVTYIKDGINKLIMDEFNEILNSNEKGSIDKVMSLISKFDMKGVHPSQFEFKEGLTYPDYLVLLILNLDKVVNLLSKEYGGRSSDSSSNSDSSNKSENDGSTGEGEENNLSSDSSNVPKTIDEFNKMIENMKNSYSTSESSNNNENSDSNGGKNSGSSSRKETKSKPSNDSHEDHCTESRDKVDKEKEHLGDSSYLGGIGRGLNRSGTTRNYVIDNDPLSISLREILSDVRNKVIKRDFSKDVTYKYNRRILGHSNRMLSPTYRLKITKSVNPTIAFFVDVSGSMRSSLVDKIITTIRNGMNKIDRSLKYSIITWDTELCEYYKDIDINSPIPRISCGGGTRLEGTFDLFKKDFSKDAIMVIISDFEDDLRSWNKKESEMNGYSMYGLKYGGCDDSYISWKNFKVRECD